MNKHKKLIEKIVQGTLTLVLFVLIFCMILNVNEIQGTARVVNYAGLVRGATQRMVKLEVMGTESQDKIAELDEYLNGIQNGSKELNLVEIKDGVYQAKVEELQQAWISLKEEIYKVRKVGAENTNIFKLSESYFALSDEAVGLAEKYSQERATIIRNLEYVIVLIIIILVGFMIGQSMAALKILRMNRDLKKKVYNDEQTGLPNKNKCLEIVENPEFIDKPTNMFMFDLNNLKFVNDNLGHGAGDMMICHFARLIRDNVPQQYFVGRYGGDEFIVITTDSEECSMPDPDEIIHNVRKSIEEFNHSGEETGISYAAGYARSEDLGLCTMAELLECADKFMYIDKKNTKIHVKEVADKLNQSLRQMIKALGNAFTECYYCNAKSGTYRVLSEKPGNLLPAAGYFTQESEKIIREYVVEEEQEEIIEKLSIEYLKNTISKDNPNISLKCQWKTSTNRHWWKVTVMFVDEDDDGNLFHFNLLCEEISEEKKFEYEATHDGLTSLWNKSAAKTMIESAVAKIPLLSHVMMIIDIDDFKGINDTYGHQMGDIILREVANVLSGIFREGDVVARFGGDEFIVFITGNVNKATYEKKAENILLLIRKRIQEKHPEISLTVSIGIAVSEEATTLEQMFEEADEALYEAKDKGKNQYSVFSAEL